MKRVRKMLKGTGKFIQITSQISKQRKPFYKGIIMMSVHEIIEPPSYGNTLYGKVWIKGDHGHPICVFAHEYKPYKMPVKRVRKITIKIKRRRLNDD
jgi:hypothetical protein